MNTITTILSSTSGVTSNLESATNSLILVAPAVAALGFVLTGLALIVPIQQIREGAKQNIFWIIIGIIIISSAAGLVTMFL